jgi:DNA-binding NtrC family response regulator
MATILCIESEPSVGVVLDDALTRIGHQTALASCTEEAFRALSRQSFDLIIADTQMSDATGFDLLERLRQEAFDIPVILTNPRPNVEDAVLSLRRGAIDYLTKPVRLDALRVAVDHAIESCQQRREIDGDPRSEGPAGRGRRIVGEAAGLKRVLEALSAVAPTRATVLLEGESGTGKELLARALHDLSPRRNQPLIVVNCAALPEGLVESTLFGHERGAFTGAMARMPGAFERAHRGTLLLDEISEMRLDLQAKLLRAIQEQEFERVGGSRPIRVDVRVVATTNRNLRAEVKAGRFRQDLYYRLSVVPIRTPALRERTEDIPLLVQHFVERCSRDLGVRPPSVSPESLAYLKSRSWPGNVRELENAVERALILCRDSEIPPDALALPESHDLPEDFTDPPRNVIPMNPSADSSVFDLKTLERTAIQRALTATGGHRLRAAKLLGISERTLRNKLNGGGRGDDAEAEDQAMDMAA